MLQSTWWRMTTIQHLRCHNDLMCSNLILALVISSFNRAFYGHLFLRSFSHYRCLLHAYTLTPYKASFAILVPRVLHLAFLFVSQSPIAILRRSNSLRHSSFSLSDHCEVTRLASLHMPYLHWLALIVMWHKRFRQVILELLNLLQNQLEGMLTVNHLGIRLRKTLFSHSSLELNFGGTLSHFLQGTLNIVQAELYLAKIILISYLRRLRLNEL